jgi:hypothetical protein
MNEGEEWGENSKLSPHTPIAWDNFQASLQKLIKIMFRRLSFFTSRKTGRRKRQKHRQKRRLFTKEPRHYVDVYKNKYH